MCITGYPYTETPLTLPSHKLSVCVAVLRFFKHNRLVFFAKQLRAYGFRQRMASSCQDVVREWYHEGNQFYRGGEKSCSSIGIVLILK